MYIEDTYEITGKDVKIRYKRLLAKVTYESTIAYYQGLHQNFMEILCDISPSNDSDIVL